METRWRMPPESSCGKLFSQPSSPTILSSSRGVGALGELPPLATNEVGRVEGIQLRGEVGGGGVDRVDRERRHPAGAAVGGVHDHGDIRSRGNGECEGELKIRRADRSRNRIFRNRISSRRRIFYGPGKEYKLL